MWGDLMAWMDAQVAMLGDLPTLAVLLAVYVFLMLETSLLVGLLVPGDLVVLVAAGLMPSWGAVLLLVAAVFAGSMTGVLVGYGLGRASGPALRRSWVGRRMGAERWRRAEEFLAGSGARALVPVRFVAVVQAVTPVVAGMVRMPLRRFVEWSALGALLWAVTFVAIGGAAGASLAEVDWTLRIGLIAALAMVVGTALGGRLVRRHRVRPDVPAAPPRPRAEQREGTVAAEPVRSR